MSSEWQDLRCRSHPHRLAEALGSVSLSGLSGQLWEPGKQPLETSAISIKGFILQAALGPEDSQLDPAAQASTWAPRAPALPESESPASRWGREEAPG